MKKHVIKQWKLFTIFVTVFVILYAQTGDALALELRIRNDFDKKMFVTVVYFDASPQKWRTLGWYSVEPRSEKKVPFSTTMQTIYLSAELSGSETTWGKGDITRTVITEAFSYCEGEECPTGKNRRSVKFTKYEANNNVIVYNPISSSPLKVAGESNTPAGNVTSKEDATVELLNLINAERRKVGAPALEFDANMQKAASRRASEITRKYSHDRPDGRNYNTVFAEFGLAACANAENIAWRSGRGNTSMSDFNKAFMDSPGHRTSMLNHDYSIVGLGYVKNGDKHYVVELFAEK